MISLQAGIIIFSTSEPSKSIDETIRLTKYPHNKVCVIIVTLILLLLVRSTKLIFGPNSAPTDIVFFLLDSTSLGPV